MSTIVINGVIYSGSNITIKNGKVSIDGKSVDVEDKVININVEGNLSSLSADVVDKLTVQGSAGSVRTQTGDVEIGGDVSGDVSTQTGDIKCGAVGGSIKTMSGDVSHRR